MQRVSEIRLWLEYIQGALRDDPEFEWRARGGVEAILSGAVDSKDRLAPAFEVHAGEDEHTEIPGELQLIVELPPEVEFDRSKPMLSDVEAEETRARVSSTGIDALAWYVTFHQLGHQWGVYISLTGLLHMADHLRPLNLTPSRRIEIALRALLRHELMHFAVDMMSAQWELATGLACYWPSRDLKDPSLGYIVDEEKLANGYMLRGFRYPGGAITAPGVYERLREFTWTMPPGYIDGDLLIRRSDFEESLFRLSESYELTTDRERHPLFMFDHLLLYPSLKPIDARYCPVFLVHDHNDALAPMISVRIIDRVDEIQEGPDFKKQLDALERPVQSAWERTKRKLAASTLIPGLDFKKWDTPSARSTFSVRVNKSTRAHLACELGTGKWMAVAIGGHKQMGHG